MSTYRPDTTTDVLLHQRDNDRGETIMYPFTRYDNVFSAPKVVQQLDENFGAPFHFYETGTEQVPLAELRRMVGNIV